MSFAIVIRVWRAVSDLVDFGIVVISNSSIVLYEINDYVADMQEEEDDDEEEENEEEEDSVQIKH